MVSKNYSNKYKSIVIKKIKTHRFIGPIFADLYKNRQLYLMVLPVVLFYLLLHYKPMYGAIIAFKDFTPSKGIAGSEWVGLKHFYEFFNSVFFTRVLKNTFIISTATIVFGFPAPILLALMLNELRGKFFPNLIQSITYMPHFISIVVLGAMIKLFTSDTGFITEALSYMGFARETMLNDPGKFVPIYVISEIWKEVGWGAIIFLAALAGVNPELYEAARIDGAGRWHQLIHVTIPHLIPTIVILLILRLGQFMSIGVEKIIVLYNPGIYETADVITTYVYRTGLIDFRWSFASAAGLFNSVINFSLVAISNRIGKKISGSSLW